MTRAGRWEAPGGDGSSWDLAIVGAGPAGSAAALGALRAKPDLRVLLLDRSDFPRDKACGDGVAPHVLDLLAGVGVRSLLADRKPVWRLRLVSGDSTADRSMARPAYVVPRRVLDARLVAAAVDAGASFRRERVRSVRCSAGGVLLDDDIRAKVVVGADGAHSAVRFAVGLPASGRRALAIRGYAPMPADRRGQQVIAFGRRRQPSYAWSFDRGDGLANVGYGEGLCSRGPHPTRALLLEQLEELLPGASSGAGDWLGHQLPLSAGRWRQPDGPVLLAGDAAGLVNPLTGEGIYYAVATGLLAGRTAAAALSGGSPRTAGSRHRSAVRALLARHLRHTWAASGLAAGRWLADAALHAAAWDQRVFDDLVEVGLGRGLVTSRVVRATAARLTRGSPLGSA